MFWQLNPDTGEYEARSCPPSVVFVGKDEEGLARYACTRSVTGDYTFAVSPAQSTCIISPCL